MSERDVMARGICAYRVPYTLVSKQMCAKYDVRDKKNYHREAFTVIQAVGYEALRHKQLSDC